MATIRDNVTRVLAELGIYGLVEIPDTARPDRLFFYDTFGQLETRTTDKAHWSQDVLKDRLHGKSLRWSRRERLRPSMQVCQHEISQVNHPVDQDGKPLPRYFYEIDFDQAGPNSIEGIFIHGEEVLVNKITGGLTSQNEIAGGLDRRLGPTSNVITA